jgi:hypothetical protein
MRTDVYRRQHHQIRTLLAGTSQFLVPLDAGACRSGLERLATVLNVHLALEDKALYPRLMTHDDPDVRRTASEFHTRMGRLAEQFEAFYAKWGRPGEIESSAYEFAVEYRALSEALRHRMDVEDATLYQLVERAS